MFGKKKATADASPVATPSPAAKAKKPKKAQKLKSGPNFFAAHAEKVALLGIVGAAGFLVYSSFSKQGLSTSQTPKLLADDASRLLTQVGENHWEAIAPERVVFAETPDKFTTDALQSRRPVVSDNFPLRKLEPAAVKDLIEKRRDPKVFPAEQIVVQNVAGALAYAVPQPEDNPDPFVELPDADPIKRASSGRNRRNQNNGAGSEGGGELGSGGPGMPGGSESTAKQIRRIHATYDLGAQVAGSMSAGFGGMGGSMGGPGGEGGEGGMGSMGGPGGFGGGSFGPGGGGVGGNGGELGKGPKGPTHRVGSTPVFFNAITALIPHRKNYQEYYDAFINTGTFYPSRDLPAYLGLEVQRADVTGNPYRELKEADWQTILTNRELAAMPLDMYKEGNTTTPKYAWATHFPNKLGDTRLGRPVPEVIDRRAAIPGITGPIPPMLITDYRSFSKHPLIDWAWNAKFIAPKKKDTSGEKKGSGEDDVILGAGSTAGGTGSGGGMMGPGGEGSMGGMGSGGMGGYDGYGGEGSGMDGYGSEGSGGEYGGMGGGSEFGGFGGGFGGGYGGMGGSNAMLPESQPEFKMIRTYDFLRPDDIRNGKTYRYRMRLTMRDPNYPENQDYYPAKFKAAPPLLPTPQNRELSHEVYERITKLRDKDDKIIEDNKAKNIYKARTMLETAWSEPSPPVTAVRPSYAFAGDVDGARGTAKIVTTVLSGNPKYPGVFLPAEVDAQRGAILGNDNTRKPVEVIAPTTKTVKKIENQTVISGQLVLDLRGGKKLEGDSKDDPLTTGGEVMIMRPDGSIFISNSLDDQLDYRLYTFQEDIEAAKKGNDAGSMGGMGGFGSGGGSGS